MRGESSTLESEYPGRRATTMAACATVIAVLPVFLLGALAIQLEADLGMTTPVLGAAAATFWAVSALLSSCGGWVVERLGSKSGLLISTALGLVALGGTAMASPEWPWLFLWLSIAAASNALAHPASNGLIVSQVSAGKRGLAFGLKQMSVPGAALTAGLSVPLLAVTLGWRWPFAIAAIYATVLLTALVRAAGPRNVPVLPTVSSVQAQMPRKHYLFLLTTAIAAGLGSAPASALGAFTVVSAAGLGFEPVTAGLILVLGSVAGCLVRPLVGLAADRGVGGSMSTVALMMAIGGAGLALMATGVPAVFSVGCLLAFGFGWGWAGLIHFVISRRSHAYMARASGMAQSGAYLGGIGGPIAFGLLFSGPGPTAAWASAAAVAGAGAAAAAVAYRLEQDLPESTC